MDQRKMRRRGYVVVQTETGDILVDSWRHDTCTDFVAWANALRRQLDKPAFPETRLQEAN